MVDDLAISEAITPDADLPLAADVYCIQCGYNLRTLSPDALCPECAAPVRKSLVNPVDMIWLQRVRRGIGLIMPVYLYILISTVAMRLIAGYMVASNSVSVIHTFTAVGRVVFLLIALIGVIYLTLTGRAPPGLPAQRTLKRLIWILAVFFGLLNLGIWGEFIRARFLAGTIIPTHVFFVLGVICRAVNYGIDVCIIVYLGRLASYWRISMRRGMIVIAAVVAAVLMLTAVLDVLRYRWFLEAMTGRRSTPLGLAATAFSLIAGAGNLIAPVICFVFLGHCRALLTRVITNRRAELAASPPARDGPSGFQAR